MIGYKTSRVGPSFGPKFQNESLSSAPVFTSDATSGKGVPATAAEWAAYFATLSQPTFGANALHLCQEASGGLADSAGSTALPALNTVTYQNAITNWARKGVGTAEGVSGAFGGNAIGPDPVGTSVAALVYVGVDATSGTCMIYTLNVAASNLVYVEMLASGFLRFGGTVSGAVVHAGIGVFPLLIVSDRTGTRFRVFTDREKIAPGYVAPTTNGERGIGRVFAGGSGLSLPATSRFLYDAWFTGAAAEWLAVDANAKAFLQGLNWSVTGY